MRAGFIAALFFSAVLVQARPPSDAKRDGLLDNLTKAAAEIFSSDLEPILSKATPEIETIFGEATGAIEKVLASNTALRAEVTSVVGAVESKATGIEQELKSGRKSSDGFHHAPPNNAATLGLGVAAALGSVLLGAYAVL